MNSGPRIRRAEFHRFEFATVNAFKSLATTNSPDFRGFHLKVVMLDFCSATGGPGNGFNNLGYRWRNRAVLVDQAGLEALFPAGYMKMRVVVILLALCLFLLFGIILTLPFAQCEQGHAVDGPVGDRLFGRGCG
jgi:hypothetical protein